MRSPPIAAAAMVLAACGSEPSQQPPLEEPQITPEPSGPPVVQQVQPEQKANTSQPAGKAE